MLNWFSHITVTKQTVPVDYFIIFCNFGISIWYSKLFQYKIGLDALLEAERIKEEIFNIEHDLWEY